MRCRFRWLLAVGLLLGLSAPAKAQFALSIGGGPYRGFGLTIGQPYGWYGGGFYPGYGYGYGYGPGFYDPGFAPYRSVYYRSYSYAYPRSLAYGAYYPPDYGYRSYGYRPYYGGRGYVGGPWGPAWGGYRRW